MIWGYIYYMGNFLRTEIAGKMEQTSLLIMQNWQLIFK